jgi:hypothetical protein
MYVLIEGKMKFQDLETVKTIVSKGKIPAGSIGTIICVFDKPNEAYMVEFCYSTGEPVDDPIYLPDEIISTNNKPSVWKK